MSREGAVFHSKNSSLALAASVPLEYDDHNGARAQFTLQTGQSARFFLQEAQEYDLAPPAFSDGHYYELLEQTLTYWRNWLAGCQYQGRWREVVQRSALVLNLLTYAPSGAIVAAPTTSLPETLGGTRNWDYRSTRLRDAAFTLYSLLILGLTQEAEAFMGWLEMRCHELQADGGLEPIYGIRGERDLPDSILDHLEG